MRHILLSALSGLAVIACSTEPVREASAEPHVWQTLNGAPTLVIAHRGASGELPEHTLEAYQLAIDQGADAAFCSRSLTLGGTEALQKLKYSFHKR